jgi:hypothetical protein
MSLGNSAFRKHDLFPSSSKGREKPTLLGPSLDQLLRSALPKGLKRLNVSLPSPERGSRSGFRNVVFSIYLEFWTVDKVNKLRHSELAVY